MKEIARTISEGRAGRDLYSLLYAGGPAYESLVAGHTESMRPPEGVTRSEWSQGLLRVARDRLHTQPLPDRGLCAQREIGVGWTG